MRLVRKVAVLVVAASPLAAQQVSRPGLPDSTALAVELNYSTGGDAWFTTNKPAYVALFDVSRGGVSQLYPVFSAQAEELGGPSGRINMRAPAALPAVTPWRSSLVPLNAPAAVAGAAAGGWPHTLLLVASTSPLRVGSAWTSNVTLNSGLFHERQWSDVTAESGIEAIIGLVRPLDPGAEVAFDRVPLATPARYTASLALDPTHLALGYRCVDGNTVFTSPTSQLGANCVPVREMPATVPTSGSALGNSVGPNDSARISQSRVVPPRANAAKSIGATDGDIRSISDPAEIRKFIESQSGGSGAAPRQSGSGVAASARPVEADRRAAVGAPSPPRDGAAVRHDDQANHRQRPANPDGAGTKASSAPPRASSPPPKPAAAPGRRGPDETRIIKPPNQGQ